MANNTLELRYHKVIDAVPLEKTKYLLFLPELLCALNWNQSPKLLTQYLSQFEQFNRREFSLLLKTMGYKLSDKVVGKSLVFVDANEDGFKITRQKENATFAVKSQLSLPAGSTWFKESLHQYRKAIRHVFLISFLLNIFLIAIPILTKQVYDKVIASHSVNTLFTLAIGAVIILSLIGLLRHHRSHLMRFLGNQMTYNAQYQVMQKLLRLPVLIIAQSSLYGHLMRVKGLEMIKELSSGSLGKALVDLPFIILTLIVIALIGHVLVIVPIIAIILYVFLAKMMTHMLNRSQAINGLKQKDKQSLFLELIKHQHALGTKSWLANYHQVNIDAARANYYNNMRLNSVQALTQSLGNLTALATLTVGIFLVLDGIITAGGLIASMMLIWRVVAPIQMIFSALTRRDNFNSTINQLNRIMSAGDELQGDYLLSNEINVTGRLKLEQVSFRYDNQSPSALLGIECDIPAQSVLVISGESGAGKTTLLRVLSGILQLQSGQMMLDEVNYKQFPKIEYRNLVMMFETLPIKTASRLIEHCHVFAPEISAEKIHHAFDLVRGKSAVFSKYSANTLIDEDTFEQNRVLMGLLLNCIRIQLLTPKIILIDDIESLENLLGEECMARLIKEYQQFSTVIIVSHGQKWVQKASHLMMLNKGQCQYFGLIKKDEE